MNNKTLKIICFTAILSSSAQAAVTSWNIVEPGDSGTRLLTVSTSSGWTDPWGNTITATNTSSTGGNTSNFHTQFNLANHWPASSTTYDPLISVDPAELDLLTTNLTAGQLATVTLDFSNDMTQPHQWMFIGLEGSNESITITAFLDGNQVSTTGWGDASLVNGIDGDFGSKNPTIAGGTAPDITNSGSSVLIEGTSTAGALWDFSVALLEPTAAYDQLVISYDGGASNSSSFGVILNSDTTIVPEPTTPLLGSLALVMSALWRRRS